MRTTRAVCLGGLGLLLFVLLLGGVFYLWPTPGKWEKLAEIIDSSGNRLVVAQEHYDLVEGWRISFTVITPDRKIYGSLLEMETGPWRNVAITEKDGAVSIWRDARQVGALTWNNRVFKNLLSGVSDSYVDDHDGVQGKSAPEKMYFD